MCQLYLGYPRQFVEWLDEMARSAPVSTKSSTQVGAMTESLIDPRSQFEEVLAACRDAEVAWIENANHSFEVKGARRPAEEIGRALAPRVAAFIAARR